MKKIIFLILTALSTNIQADTVLGIEGGVQSWYHDNSGNITTPLNVIPFTSDLNSDNETALSYFIALEHGVPFVPNFKIKHSNIDGNFINQLDVCPPENPCNSPIDLNLSHTDFTLYYELLDNWVNLDLGLSAIYFNGNKDFSNLNDFSQIDYSETVPAVYGKAEFKFPTTDLSASLTANVGTFSDKSISDMELAAKYKFALGFIIEAGYRKQIIDLEYSNQIKVDATSSGVFAALNFDF